MARRHWLGLLGSAGAVFAAFAEAAQLPNEVAYGSLAIGIVALLLVAFDWYRERQRGLNVRRRDAMAAGINANGGIDRSVLIRFAQGCTECRLYADDFAKVFRLIGWVGEVGVSLDERPDLSGVRIVVRDPKHPSKMAQAIVAGMQAARIRFDWWANVDMADNQVVLWVYPARR